MGKLVAFGAFSSVYEIDDGSGRSDMGNDIVVKVLEDNTDDFELVILPTLHHANIIRVIRVNKRLREVYIERHPLTLSQFINDYKSLLTWSSVKYIFKQILQGLSYLKQQRIIHYDMKTSNIMIDPTTLRTTIIDFNLSYKYNSDNDKKYLGCRGTWSYMAPEVVCCLPLDYDENIDIWGAWMILYRMVVKGKLLVRWEDYLVDSLGSVGDDNRKIRIAYIKALSTAIDYPPITWLKGWGDKYIPSLVEWQCKNDTINSVRYSGVSSILDVDRVSVNIEDKYRSDVVEWLRYGLIINYKERPSADDILNKYYSS